MGLTKLLKDIFGSKYKYVPPCPRCGSLRTGYYLQVSTPYVDKIYIKHANRGEIVRCIDSLYILDYNAFCEDCGIEWNANIEYKPLTPELIDEEKKNRGISSEYREDFEDAYVLTKKEKKAAKVSKKLFIKGEDDAEEILKDKRNKRLKKILGRSLKSTLPFYDEVSELTLKNKRKKELRDEIDNEFTKYGI